MRSFPDSLRRWWADKTNSSSSKGKSMSTGKSKPRRPLGPRYSL